MQNLGRLRRIQSPARAISSKTLAPYTYVVDQSGIPHFAIPCFRPANLTKGNGEFVLQLQSNLLDFNRSKLSEFGLNPRDWLLADPTNQNQPVLHLLHRDDEEIFLKVRVQEDGEIHDVELLVHGQRSSY